MAPGGRRGAKGLKTKSELRLGDLVLAKVKGYPAWPAKISRPEDWERAPDPKKYFVYFFGTKEIAFVAPGDIQAFTSDAKHKLLARCQGKTVKYFAQAVREICEEFEELQHKNLSGVRDDSSTQTLASKAHSLDSVVDGALEADGIDKDGENSKVDAKGPSDVKSGFDHCSKRQDEVEGHDMNHMMKPCSPGDRNHSSSPQISSGKRNKLSTNSSNIVKEDGSDSIKVEGTCSGDRQNELTNGHKLKLAMGSKKKVEVARRNSGSAVSHELTGEGMQKKILSGDSMKVSSDNSRSGLDVGGERKDKKLLKERNHSEAADDGAGKLRSQTSRKNDSRSPGVHDVKVTSVELKRLPVGKMESRRLNGVQIITDEFNHLTDEDDLPPTKRHRRALDATSISALIPENKLGSSLSRKNDLISANKARSPVMQLPVKRRAVRLCADVDDDELPKTPIHGGFTNKVSVTPHILDSKKKPVIHGASRVDDQLVSKNSGPVDHELNEKAQSARVSNGATPLAAQQGMDKRTRELSSLHVSSSPLQIHYEKLSSMEATPVLVSPKRSFQTLTGTRPSSEAQNMHSGKAPGIISQKKAPAGSNRGLPTASDRSTLFPNQLLSERNKLASSGEKRKTTPKSDSRIDDSVLLVRNQNENITTSGDRLDIGKGEKTRFPIDSKIPDSVMSMKHLIAAAQARKKAAHLQNSFGNLFPLLVPDGDMHGQSPSLNLATQAFESNNMVQPDVLGLRPTSPTSDHQCSSFNQLENEELDERRISSGHQATGSSLSGGTEAAVARDAFEGMIETLSRTKESIGRATRLAIDCAKYGIANEVVELLMKKLENESSLHRRVDLFFLVDSITQCSHNQRGIAGASYIPTVQAALPRIIGAVAPPSAGAQENRRQCRKVLRLWLERKILPESVLRRCMDDIGVVNDDSATGISLRRPSRAERSIDDPIREMEGMVVDEYGSNATFQLPGLLSSHVFEEDEEYEDNFQTNICKEVVDTSPSKHTPSSNREPENYTVTPSDRRHCILEDVDGELEMEDVSGHQKEERPLFNSGTLELVSLEPNSNGIHESASNISPEWLSSPEGSPPLPPGTPPVTPPLPTSPPPALSSPPPPPPPYLPPPPPVGPLPLLSQQSHAGHNSSRPVEYGLDDAYINPQASQHTHQFLPGSAPFAQRPLRPELPPPQPPTHFAYSNSVQQHQYPPYSLLNLSDCTRRYANDEQMRMQVEFNADGPRVGWMAGGRSYSGPPYPHEGYFGPLAERPPASVVNYQPSAPNTLSAPTSTAGHSVAMMPCRPDMPAVNWRPT